MFAIQKTIDKTSLLRKKEAEVVKIQADAGKCDIKAILEKLAERGVQQILVEGGKEVVTSFLKQKLAAEIIIYTSSERLADKGRVKTSPEMEKAYNYVKNNYYEKKRFDADLCLKAFTK